MKAFYIIIIVLLLMLGLILYYSAYIRNFAEEAIITLENAHIPSSQNSKNEMFDLQASIENFLTKAEFALTRKKSDTLRDYATLLVIQADTGNIYEFEATRSLTVNLLKNMADLERASLKNLF